MNSTFVKRQCYTRAHIKMVLGGSAIGYLPNVDQRVVCGCFNKQCNPDAPDVIIPGTGPEIEYSARIFCNQKTPVPIFIKLRPNCWQYVGDYKVKSFTTNRDVIAQHHKGSITRLDTVTRVIFLECAA